MSTCTEIDGVRVNSWLSAISKSGFTVKQLVGSSWGTVKWSWVGKQYSKSSVTKKMTFSRPVYTFPLMPRSIAVCNTSRWFDVRAVCCCVELPDLQASVLFKWICSVHIDKLEETSSNFQNTIKGRGSSSYRQCSIALML